MRDDGSNYDKAVLDRETGLVWERQPSNQTFAWPNARLHCAQKAVKETWRISNQWRAGRASGDLTRDDARYGKHCLV